MSVVDRIFAACDAAGVRIWHVGGKVGFQVRDASGLPAPLAALLKGHKAELLDKIPDGFEWDRGAKVHDPTAMTDPVRAAALLGLEAETRHGVIERRSLLARKA